MLLNLELLQILPHFTYLLSVSCRQSLHLLTSKLLTVHWTFKFGSSIILCGLQVLINSALINTFLLIAQTLPTKKQTAETLLIWIQKKSKLSTPISFKITKFVYMQNWMAKCKHQKELSFSNQTVLLGLLTSILIFHLQQLWFRNINS